MEREKYLRIFRGKKELILELEKRLNYTFRDKSYLVRALIHSSYANEFHRNKIESNERFEFIGDSVLNYIISTTLYRFFPGENEGFLSKVRSFLVSTETIYEIAVNFDLGKYLILGKGEKRSGGNKKKNLVVDSFEAIIAAIFFDGGLKSARKVVLKFYREKLKALREGKPPSFDYKSRLQEVLARRGGKNPTYILLEEKGPDHNKVFRIQVKIGGDDYGIGEGHSKKEAQQIAAKNTLDILEERGE